MYTIIYVSDSHKHFKGVIQEYEKRLSNQLRLICIAPEKGTDEAIVKKKETQKIIEKIQKQSSYNIFLDETGVELDSIDFEKHIHQQLHEYPRVCFIIGGAYGLDKSLIQSHIHKKIRLGKMTLPHGLALGVLMEQVYRATMIQKGAKYHHK